jgi:hypothetical protein
MSSFDASFAKRGFEIAPTTKRAVTDRELDRSAQVVSERQLILSPMVLICGQSGGHPPNLLRDDRDSNRALAARSPHDRGGPGYGGAMSDEPTAGPKLQVQIDDDVSQGVYSNLVLLNHTENEFVLDFAFIQPANGRAKVRTRVISSPKHTKRLLQALQKNLERYEERFGTIETSNDDEPMFH